MHIILYIIGIPYGFGVVIFGFYYNWLYAQQNGFVAWFFFGEIIATLKALIWPLIEFNII
jgi:hypothetical protein